MFYDSVIRKRIPGIVLAMITLGSVAGCGASPAEMPAEITEQYAVVDTPQAVDYKVPVQIPRALVDQVGYSAGSEKAVIFSGEDIPLSFDVIDAESGQKVFSGETLKPSFNEELSEHEAFGYFNDLNKPGEYFVYTDKLGESYSFSIKNDIYEDVFSEAIKKFYINRCGIALSENYAGESAHSACHTTAARLQDATSVTMDVTGGWHLDETAGRDAALGSRIAETLLLAFEMNPTAFGDNTGIPESGNKIPDILDEVKYEADWLLKMQDSKTGGVYGAAVTDAAKGGDLLIAPVIVTPIDLEATVSFAAMMARLSYFYQEYDTEAATAYLKAADRAFTCYLNNRQAAGSSGAFKAAAQLYRATGTESYSEIMEEFFARSDFNELFEKDENVFLGAVTYLSINEKVDVDRCSALMKLLMASSEDIAERASRSGYLVSDMGSGNDFKKMLSDMRILSITNHIIYNYEYTTIIENHIHYLAGMNPEAVNYLTADTQRSFAEAELSGIMNDPENDALLIFMFSVLEQ